MERGDSAVELKSLFGQLAIAIFCCSVSFGQSPEIGRAEREAYSAKLPVLESEGELSVLLFLSEAGRNAGEGRSGATLESRRVAWEQWGNNHLTEFALKDNPPRRFFYSEPEGRFDNRSYLTIDIAATGSAETMKKLIAMPEFDDLTISGKNAKLMDVDSKLDWKGPGFPKVLSVDLGASTEKLPQIPGAVCLGMEADSTTYFFVCWTSDAVKLRRVVRPWA